MTKRRESNALVMLNSFQHLILFFPPSADTPFIPVHRTGFSGALLVSGDNTMGKADRISGCFWLVFSVFVSYESYQLGLGTLTRPGPGFLFFWIGIVIGILSVTVVLRSFLSRKPDEGREIVFKKSNLAKVVLVLISLFLYSLFMERLGFLIVTLLLFIFLLRVVEKKRWSFAVLVSFIVTVIAYLVFEKGLQSQLPAGLLEFLRF